MFQHNIRCSINWKVVRINAYRHKYSVLFVQLSKQMNYVCLSQLKAQTAESFLEFLSDSSTRADINHYIAGTVGVS